MNVRRKIRRGFSLIELLVVLVILALLVGLVAPRFLSQIGRGQQAAAKTQIANFKSAIGAYQLDHNGQVPADLNDLIVAPSTSSTEGGKWKGPYLNDATTVPVDPWGRPFDYIVPGPAGNDYEIRSLGEDGREGGTGQAEDLSSIR
ncbi:MAG TPA: type II secretion system major pseudopilin GspG [Armatimonadota bacterium]|nr:type II secretion system major pseudopilin GspG [Armatimonadota bacterium]